MEKISQDEEYGLDPLGRRSWSRSCRMKKMEKIVQVEERGEDPPGGRMWRRSSRMKNVEKILQDEEDGEDPPGRPRRRSMDLDWDDPWIPHHDGTIHGSYTSMGPSLDPRGAQAGRAEVVQPGEGSEEPEEQLPGWEEAPGRRLRIIWRSMEETQPRRCRRVGILGYGQLGRFLVSRLQSRGPPLGLSLAFVWARGGLEQLPPHLRLHDLRLLPRTGVDLVVEVAHPCVAKEHGEDILAHADFMVGSPTALADPETERRLREAVARGGHTLYVPRGALWGCEDIRRMDQAGTLAGLKVTMTKAPQSFRLAGRLQERLEASVASGDRVVLYEGPLRPLCPLAPNNVNTMAVAAVAAPRLGFDGVQACLVADPSVPDCHIVEVEVTGVGDEGRALRVTSVRRNPASPGAVTGSATRDTFWDSLTACHGHGGCVQLC
ncbi:aspartate dehydrogenase domain-containing protein [Phaenicophaeus curvirostris]|uniref:aspartate dehydrogenase domain-containing protein n=1 Tax=Phaenicophaeus curvirostris TaxID=33595 RepID=UPI0037F0FCD5